MLAPSASPDLASALHEGTDRQETDSTLPRLLDVQFWLIGRDVEHPDGSLLVRMGFDREPAPDRAARYSRYRRTTEGTTAVLWSWGLFLRRARGGLLLTRGGQGAAMPLGRAPDVYVPPPSVTSGRCPAGLLADACRWLAAYEDDVTTAFGLGHRVPRPGSNPSLAPPEPWSLAAAWLELGELIERRGVVPRTGELAPRAPHRTAREAIARPRTGRAS